tara:strand:+ start:123 stop:377 length:255 start_codon:yes stop_codon:yes gene_type:complete
MKITKSRLKEIIREEILAERDVSDYQLPGQVERFTNKLIDQIKRIRLNRPKKYAIVARIILALGIEINKLSQMMNLIKRDMKNK